MITMLVHASFLLAAGAGPDVHDVPVRIELPRRPGTSGIGQRDRARLRARIIAAAVDQAKVSPATVNVATFSFDDPGLASSMGYAQITRRNEISVVCNGPGWGQGQVRASAMLREMLGRPAMERWNTDAPSTEAGR